jgi:hypothetical protein
VEDMLRLLDCLAVKDHRDHENFWSQQKYVTIEEVKRPESFLELLDNSDNALKGKRLAAPKMFIGGDDPKSKPTSHSSQTTKMTPHQATQTTSSASSQTGTAKSAASS